MTRTSAVAIALTALATLACTGEPLAETKDVSGNLDITYTDNLRIYVNDDLIAEIIDGEPATVEINGQTLAVDAICGDAGTECPSEVYWRTIGVDQPWGADNRLLNFINLDPERGQPGQRMGGILDDPGTFVMLAGLDLQSNDACAALGVGSVEGTFSPTADRITDGIIRLEWGAGCVFGDVTIDGKLRLETDYTGVRTGDLDLSSVTPEPPIDEEGDEVDTDVPAGDDAADDTGA